MASSNALFFVFAFLLVAFAKASIDGGHCSDVSHYDHIRYHQEEAECCEAGDELRCEDREEEVCVDITEVVCDVNAYANCEVYEAPAGSSGCGVVYKNFEMNDCEEHEYKTAHIKQVPVCRNVTKNNCVTDWQVDDNGNKVWTGLENCTPVTWEECSIVDTEVDFPSVRTECGVVSHIKYLDFTQEGGATSVSTNCNPVGVVSCRPVTRTDCVKLTYTDCSINGKFAGCNKPKIFVPSQEKIHQKKCLE